MKQRIPNSYTFEEFKNRFNNIYGKSIKCTDWEKFREGTLVAKLDFEIERGNKTCTYDVDKFGSYCVEKLTGLSLNEAVREVYDLCKPFGTTHASFKYIDCDGAMPDNCFCFCMRYEE